MESNRKRRGGFIKGKLVPFYRVSKPSSTLISTATTTTSTTSKQYMMSSKVKPSQQAYPLPSSVGFVVHNHNKEKITFIVPPSNLMNSHGDRLKQQQFDHNLAGDEMVDMKAATYISSVQERFKLERNS